MKQPGFEPGLRISENYLFSDMTQPLRIFVAMPGTSMGQLAAFKTPDAIKQNLLEPVREKLKSALSREVEIIIEKEKDQVGPIHSSMFAEAYNAEVYIADLTGANPNVYLELGVRWALKDMVTVIIYQNDEDLKFNVSSSRGIKYTPDNIMAAQGKIVAAITTGLSSKECDSPVLHRSDLVIITRKELSALEAEIQALKSARGEDLLKAARMATTSEQIRLLKLVTETNPSSLEAWEMLGIAYRKTGQHYDEAINAIQQAIALAPGKASLQRELGLVYSKQQLPVPAIAHLRNAVQLDPLDAEAWSMLGGVLRRSATMGAPNELNQTELQEALHSYQKAAGIKQYDLYALMNIPRTKLLLSKWEPQLYNEAIADYEQAVDLCRFQYKQQQDNWRAFDLAEALVFTDHVRESVELFEKAIKETPGDERAGTFGSVVKPMQDYLKTGILSDQLSKEITAILALFNA